MQALPFPGFVVILMGAIATLSNKPSEPLGRMAMRCVLALCLAPALVAATPIGPITDVAVLENGVGPEAEGCGTHVVTPGQVREFFESALLISARQQHDNFLYGSCVARGTLKSCYDTWHWEIRSLGTGSLRATNGEVFLLGDPGQESGLDQ